MNRRIFTAWLAASGLTTAFAMSRPARDRALAHTATPVPPFNGGTCNLELDFADFTAQLEIPEEIGWEQYDLIVSILSARIHRLGWPSCNVSRYEREILVNVQVEPGRDLDVDLIGELLAAEGRVDVIDPGESTLEIGEKVTTSTTPVGPNGPLINVVYGAILINLDFESVEVSTDAAGGPAALITIHETAVEKVASFAADNAGKQVPLVIDGVVTLTPSIQAGIGAEFILQPVEPEMVERLHVYTAAPPLPGPLVVTAVRDNRATPAA